MLSITGTDFSTGMETASRKRGIVHDWLFCWTCGHACESSDVVEHVLCDQKSNDR